MRYVLEGTLNVRETPLIYLGKFVNKKDILGAKNGEVGKGHKFNKVSIVDTKEEIPPSLKKYFTNYPITKMDEAYDLCASDEVPFYFSMKRIPFDQDSKRPFWREPQNITFPFPHNWENFLNGLTVNCPWYEGTYVFTGGKVSVWEETKKGLSYWSTYHRRSLGEYELNNHHNAQVDEMRFGFKFIGKEPSIVLSSNERFIHKRIYQQPEETSNLGFDHVPQKGF